MSPAEQEVQDYLEKVKAGQAGIDPKLQTRARSGDPYAQAEVNFRMAMNSIAAQVAEGQLSEAEAVAKRGAVQGQYTAEVQRIQSAEQHEELMDELRRKRR